MLDVCTLFYTIRDILASGHLVIYQSCIYVSPLELISQGNGGNHHLIYLIISYHIDNYILQAQFWEMSAL